MDASDNNNYDKSRRNSTGRNRSDYNDRRRHTNQYNDQYWQYENNYQPNQGYQQNYQYDNTNQNYSQNTFTHPNVELAVKQDQQPKQIWQLTFNSTSNEKNPIKNKIIIKNNIRQKAYVKAKTNISNHNERNIPIEDKNSEFPFIHLENLDVISNMIDETREMSKDRSLRGSMRKKNSC